VRQQLFDGDRSVVGIGGADAEPGQVLGHRIVQPQLALFTQLHHRGGGEELAVRGHAELGLWRHRSPGGHVGDAETGGPHQLLIGDDADGDARQVPGQHLTLEPCAEQSLRALHVGIGGEALRCTGSLRMNLALARSGEHHGRESHDDDRRSQHRRRHFGLPARCDRFARPWSGSDARAWDYRHDRPPEQHARRPSTAMIGMA
jgi:hypothetical protein